jgi:plastocyanin
VRARLIQLLIVLSVVALAAFAPSSAATSHVIRLRSNRFVPTEVTARPGDTLRFVNGEGGPHNVEFVADSIATPSRRLLIAAMGKDTVRALGGPWLILADEAYQFVVPNLPPGRYPWLCAPHFANMRGALLVDREK